MGTTFSNYGKLPAYQVRDVIGGLDFTGKKKSEISKDKLKKLLEMIED